MTRPPPLTLDAGSVDSGAAVQFEGLRKEINSVQAQIDQLQKHTTGRELLQASREFHPLVDSIAKPVRQYKLRTGKVSALSSGPQSANVSTTSEYMTLYSLSSDGLALAWDAATGNKFEAIKVSNGHTMTVAAPRSGLIMAAGGLACTVDIYAIGDRLGRELGETVEPYRFELDARTSSPTVAGGFWGADVVPHEDGKTSPTNSSRPGSRGSRSVNSTQQRAFPRRKGIFNQPIPGYVDNETLNQYRTTMVGHSAAITCSKFASEELLISGDAAANTIVWDVPRSQSVVNVYGHQGSINFVSGSPADSTQFATGGDDGLLNVWDLRSGKRTLSMDSPDGGPWVSGDYHPAGRVIVAATEAHVVAIDSSSTKTIAIVPTPGPRISSMAISRSGRAVAVGFVSGAWALLDLFKSQWTLSAKAHNDSILSICIADSIIVTSSYDRIMKSWRIEPAVPEKGNRPS